MNAFRKVRPVLFASAAIVVIGALAAPAMAKGGKSGSSSHNSSGSHKSSDSHKSSSHRALEALELLHGDYCGSHYRCYSNYCGSYVTIRASSPALLLIVLPAAVRTGLLPACLLRAG